MIKYVDGNLFDFIDDHNPIMIAHVCNNQGAAGAGFVLPLAAKYPTAIAMYYNWYKRHMHLRHDDVYCRKFYEQAFGLGSIQIVAVDNHVYVANMVAQILGGKRPLYYNHLVHCMDTIAEQALEVKDFPSNIICPQFGAGLAGGNWDFIEELINDCWVRVGLEVTVVRYKS